MHAGSSTRPSRAAALAQFHSPFRGQVTPGDENGTALDGNHTTLNSSAATTVAGTATTTDAPAGGRRLTEGDGDDDAVAEAAWLAQDGLRSLSRGLNHRS